MQHAQKSQLRSQPLRIGSHFQKRLGGSPEQQIVDDALVLPGDARHRIRQRENDVKVLDWQQLLLPRQQPGFARLSLALGTMPIATGVIDHLAMSTMPAERDVSTESGRTTRRKALQDGLFFGGDGAPAEERGGVLANDVSDFERGAASGGSWRAKSSARLSSGLLIDCNCPKLMCV